MNRPGISAGRETTGPDSLIENGTFKYTFALVSRYSREQTDSAEPRAQVALRGRKEAGGKAAMAAAQNDQLDRLGGSNQTAGFWLKSAETFRIIGHIKDISGRAKMRRIL